MSQQFNRITFKQFDLMVKNLGHPKVIYLCESDFDFVLEHASPKRRAVDQDGVYLMWTTTKVRPKIQVYDLSDSHLFVEA